LATHLCLKYAGQQRAKEKEQTETTGYVWHRWRLGYPLLPRNALVLVDVNYLADNILVLRYFEAQGELRLGPDMIRVGELLTKFHGVLSGTPMPLGHDGHGIGPR
jgi:hypothetical protein